MHYSARYKKRIAFLEGKIADYYHAIRDAKQAAGIRLGVSGISSLRGAEESPAISDPETLRKIINALPEWDCGVL